MYNHNKILLEAGNNCLQEVGNNLQGNMMGMKGSPIVEVVVVDSIVVVVEVVDNMGMGTVRMPRIVVVVADCNQMIVLGLDCSLMKIVQLEQLPNLMVYLYLSLVEQLKFRIHL